MGGAGLDTTFEFMTNLMPEQRQKIGKYADLTVSNANNWNGAPKFFSIVFICVVSLFSSP